MIGKLNKIYAALTLMIKGSLYLGPNYKVPTTSQAWTLEAVQKTRNQKTRPKSLLTDPTLLQFLDAG